MKAKWSVEEIGKRETTIDDKEMQERLADVWELLQSVNEPPAQALPKTDARPDVKDSNNKRSAS